MRSAALSRCFRPLEVEPKCIAYVIHIIAWCKPKTRRSDQPTPRNSPQRGRKWKAPPVKKRYSATRAAHLKLAFKRRIA